jgi:hypothetical protein
LLTRQVPTRDALLRLPLPEEVQHEPAAEAFLFGLATEIRERQEEGRGVFERV